MHAPTVFEQNNDFKSFAEAIWENDILLLVDINYPFLDKVSHDEE